jgi:DNA-binding MarR family transcriptional regulator
MMLAGGALAQRGGGFGRGGGGAAMLRLPEVQSQLKLTDEQKTKVTDALAKLQEQRQGQSFQGLSPEERQKMLAVWRAAEDKLLGDVLNADQMKRYHQLVLQQQGMSAVVDKAVADQLKLTDDQKTKIQAVIDEQRAAMQELRQNGGTQDREAMMKKMQEMRKQTDEKIASLLTDDQKNQWKEMTGAPFTFPTPGPRPGA